MAKKISYLDFHYQCLSHGLPSYGLCERFGEMFEATHDELFMLFYPNTEEYPIMLSEKNLWNYFWAADGETDGRTKMGEYTPMRQNIVLLMAAMNGEL